MADNDILRKIQRHLDELRVKMELGKADATDYLREHNFTEFLEKAGAKVADNQILDEEKKKSIQRKLDELRLQLALGRMDSEDAFRAQQVRISKAIESLEDDLHPLVGKAEKLIGDAGSLLAEGIGLIREKLDSIVSVESSESIGASGTTQIEEKLEAFAKRLESIEGEQGASIRTAFADLRRTLNSANDKIPNQ